MCTCLQGCFVRGEGGRRGGSGARRVYKGCYGEVRVSSMVREALQGLDTEGILQGVRDYKG